MTPEHWRQVEQIYHSTLEREESQRSSFLKAACAGDEVLRREVESLLAHKDQAESFIERQPWKRRLRQCSRIKANHWWGGSSVLTRFFLRWEQAEWEKFIRRTTVDWIALMH